MAISRRLGSAAPEVACAWEVRDWWLWVARHSQGEAQPLAARFWAVFLTIQVLPILQRLQIWRGLVGAALTR